MRASLASLPLAFAAVTAAATAAAQTQTRPGSIAGLVKDSAGAPIEGVEIVALAAGKATRSDSLGHFFIPDIASGNLDISFRRLSYAPAIANIAVPPTDTTEVEVTLKVIAQQLKSVVVQAHPDQLRRLVAFEARRKRGIGHFVTRSQIEERRPLLLSDMLRMIPGAILINADNGRTAVRFARVARNNCPPQFFIDGIEVTGFSIDDMPPNDVEGIELYAGSAGLPPEYNRLHGTSICGTIVIWTRIPTTAKYRP